MPVDRVLMTADAVGGVWPYTLDLARGLIARGVAVDVAVMGPPPDHRQRADARAAGVSLFELPYRLEWMDDPWQDVDRAGQSLLNLARDLGPDVVHLNGFCHAALPWSVPVVVVAHSCVLSWWRAVHGEEAPAAFDEYRIRVARGVTAAAAVVAPSRAMLREVEREYGIPARPHVIPNGRSAVATPNVAREHIVFTAARLWDEAKNVQAACAAAARVTWPLFVAGDDRDPHGRTVAPSGARYLGKLTPEAMAGWYARASIYALPARYEPFGLSVLEAAGAGCALVLGDIPSLRENWDGVALFVPPADADALAAAIQLLIDDAPRRRRLAAAAVSRATAFPVDRMIADYFNTYSGLAPVGAA
jgi:glycosyltransferase involved in cell wall biosynthesis